MFGFEVFDDASQDDGNHAAGDVGWVVRLRHRGRPAGMADAVWPKFRLFSRGVPPSAARGRHGEVAHENDVTWFVPEVTVGEGTG